VLCVQRYFQFHQLSIKLVRCTSLYMDPTYMWRWPHGDFSLPDATGTSSKVQVWCFSIFNNSLHRNNTKTKLNTTQFLRFSLIITYKVSVFKYKLLSLSDSLLQLIIQKNVVTFHTSNVRHLAKKILPGQKHEVCMLHTMFWKLILLLSSGNRLSLHWQTWYHCFSTCNILICPMCIVISFKLSFV
jgi:hypothetical protein